jgi:hypothetical protein
MPGPGRVRQVSQRPPTSREISDLPDGPWRISGQAESIARDARVRVASPHPIHANDPNQPPMTPSNLPSSRLPAARPRSASPWRQLCRAVLAGAIPGLVMAQQIFVVQANGGTPYQTIDQAIQAANHGDIIQVGPGLYGSFSCNKAIRLEGGPGVTILETSTSGPAVIVGGLPAGGLFSMHSFSLWRSGTNARIQLSGPGTVLLDNIANGGDWPRLGVTSLTGGLLATNCRFGGLNFIQNSTVHTVGCDWRSDGGVLQGPLVALSSASLHVVDGALTYNYSWGGSCFQLNNSRLTLGVVNGLQLNGPPAGWPVPHSHFDIDATSSVVQHTAVTPSAPVFAAGQSNWVRNDTPISIRVAPAGPGGTVTSTVFGTGPLELVILFVGSQVGQYSLPGVTGPLFLSNAAFVVNLGFVATTGVAVGVSFGVPNVPSLTGFPLAVQGITGSGRMTNAAGFTLR